MATITSKSNCSPINSRCTAFNCRVQGRVRKVWFKENSCVMIPDGLKKRVRSAIVRTEQQKNIFFIYSYVQGTYRENISQDKTNKNGERVIHFILAINICLNKVEPRNFVPIITTLLKLSCKNFGSKQENISHISMSQTHPLNSMESISMPVRN